MERKCSNFLPPAAPPAGASRQPGGGGVLVRTASFGAFARHLSAVLAGSRYNFGLDIEKRIETISAAPIYNNIDIYICIPPVLSCSNAPPKIEIDQGKKHLYAIDITSKYIYPSMAKL